MEAATFHRLFGKIFIKALLMGLLPASRPFDTGATLRADPALVGSYGPEGPTNPVASGAERETLRITQSMLAPRDYTLSISGRDETLEFDARLFELAVASGTSAFFLDLAPRKDPGKHFGSLAKHLTAEIRRRADGFDFAFPTDDSVSASGLDGQVSPERKDECSVDADASYSAGDYCARALTAPTPALQELLRSIARKKSFGNVVRLYRFKPAS